MCGRVIMRCKGQHKRKKEEQYCNDSILKAALRAFEIHVKVDKGKHAPSSGLTLERKSARQGLLEHSCFARPVPSTSAVNQVQ